MEFRKFVENIEINEISDFDILKLYLHKTKVSEISQHTGKSVGEIYRILKRHKVSPNRLNTKHSQVTAFADGGFTIGEIAALTGYSKRNVRYILSRQLNEEI